jgi:hypothetical protein
MFIGIPLSCRNTESIREAINTFGEFHYWLHRDVQLYRTLVYVTYPAPSLVPHDVVFRQPFIGRHSGIRHSWTAPCFILSSEFADVHPTNEDPMSLNGNPHPLPGQLIPDDLAFAQPEYPEIGWNMPLPPLFADDVPQQQNQNDQQKQHDQPPQQAKFPPHDSVSVNHSGLSSASVQLENADMEVDMMEVDPPGDGMQLVIFNQDVDALVFQNPPGQEADLVAPNLPGSPVSEGENEAGLQLAVLNHAPIAENL